MLPHVFLYSQILISLTIWTEAQKLDKPAIWQNLDMFGPDLMQHLPRAQHQINHAPSANSTFTDCINTTLKHGFHSEDIELFEVKYEDCEYKWKMCRHKDSKESQDGLAELFGRVPVRARQWIKWIASLPAEHGYPYCSAIADAGGILLSNCNGTELELAIHETSHLLDNADAYKIKGISRSDEWKNMYKLDQGVPDRYSQTDMIENFAQVSVIAVLNINHPQSSLLIQEVPMFNQLGFILKEQARADSLLVSNGTCNRAP